MIFPISGQTPNYTLEETKTMMRDLDTDPLKNSGVKVVYPVGDGSSGVFLVGEAPGQKEDELGEPFVGASGRFLNNTLLPSANLNRQNIYLTNIVKCRPPENRDPLPEEKEAWGGVLLAEILAIRPKVIVCLGRHSLGFFFPEAKISKVHGQALNLKMFEDYTQAILPMYHPAVALYNPNMREVLQKDFLMINQLDKALVNPTQLESKVTTKPLASSESLF
ncbi:MAG: uracil-DNA glycosylase [Patescibacteria group bacterium]